MDFWEAVQAMERGESIRAPYWKGDCRMKIETYSGLKDIYLCCGNDKVLLSIRGELLFANNFHIFKEGTIWR